VSLPEIPGAVVSEEIHQLYEYWKSRLAGRRYPARRNIDPLDFRYLLGRIMLVDVLPDPVRFRIRLQGVEFVKYFGRDLTGKFFDDIARPELRGFILQRAKELMEIGEPYFARRELIMDKQSIRFEVAMLPLADDGQTIDMAIVAVIFPDFPSTVRT
jgi:hypothetical protein